MVSKEIADQLNNIGQQPNTTQQEGTPGNTPGVSLELAARLNQAEEAIHDDSWSALGKDILTGIQQGGTWNWIDDIFDGYTADEYDIAQQRNPYATLGAEFVGGAAADIGITAGVGAAAGSVVPGAGNVAGGITGAAVGAGKATARFANTINRLNKLYQTKSLAKRTALFGGVGATHGAIAGAGSANQYGQSRLEGAAEGALFGGTIAGAIPGAGAVLRGIAKAPRFIARQLAKSTPARQAASEQIVDDIYNIIKNPQAITGSIGNNFNGLVKEVDRVVDKTLEFQYKHLDNQGISVNIGNIRKQFNSIAKRYDSLGRKPIGDAIRKSIGERDTVSFRDARVLKDNISKLHRNGDIDGKDIDSLKKALGGEIEKGVKKRGATVSGFYNDLIKAQDDITKLTQRGLFQKGLNDPEILNRDINAIVSSSDPRATLISYKDILNNIKSKTPAVTAQANELKDSINAIAIKRLLDDNGKLLKRLNGKGEKYINDTLDILTEGNKDARELLKELTGIIPTNKKDPLVTLAAHSASIGTSTATGFIAGGPAGAILGTLLSSLSSVGISKAFKSPKVRNLIRGLLKSKTPTEAERQRGLLFSELLALGIVLPGSLALGSQ